MIFTIVQINAQIGMIGLFESVCPSGWIEWNFGSCPQIVLAGALTDPQGYYQ
jgi:hypothetical protein